MLTALAFAAVCSAPMVTILIVVTARGVARTVTAVWRALIGPRPAAARLCATCGTPTWFSRRCVDCIADGVDPRGVTA